MYNQFAIFTVIELQRMITFYRLSPNNKQAMETADLAEQEIGRRKA